ncbi:DUF3592 domain-containing protein [Arthrobacter sp. zg-Y1143]|uniref:DUF3592 domain-containing protein n=1 Tax=Arthrobacter sp. zg-Y1143 TaxID=3049065 RepID=UPI0024C30F20|nr:DUF3592 domain-containing protein [Arthrobacter sp. zg-Y1143]MDK1326634.1 DUF3592 domain-containing protein [Arthrobacter sp. zg-Y1143]
MTVNTDPGLPREDGSSAAAAKTAKTAKGKHHPLTDLAVGLVLLLAGLFLGIDDISDSHRDHQLISMGVQTQGTVTEVVFEHRRKKGDKKVVTASYQDTKGHTHSVTYKDPYRSKEEGSKAEVSKKLRGAGVTVFYERSNPGEAVVQGQEASTGVGYFIIAFFGLLSCLFLVPLVKGLKKKAKPADEGAGSGAAGR